MLAKQLQGAALATQPVFIEDTFQSWLYTGTGATQTITNGIDLSGKGGLLWIKSRSNATTHTLHDTNRGATKRLRINTDAEATVNDLVTSFNSNGFTLGADAGNSGGNFSSAYTYVSWTFRKQAKFFDVVTYTGNGSNRTIAHNLGSVPGTIIIKRTDTTGAWAVYHRSLANTEYLVLNTTAAKATGATYWNSTTPTSTEFSLGTATDVNANAGTYVAYLFAHDAGGFGAAGTDNVISCGSFTGTATVNLGYEPQWVLIKNTTVAENWILQDTMRGFVTASGSGSTYLTPNTSDAETGGAYMRVTSTGFTCSAGANTYIYIAIRRGPMKTPTSGTSVFTPATRTGTNTVGEIISNAGFPVDLIIGRNRALANDAFIDRLRGIVFLRSDNTDAEASATSYISSLATQAGWINSTGGSGGWNTSPNNYIQWYFRRAPGFFDVVCYTGNGSSSQDVNHNLGVAPELIIVKGRNAALAGTDWFTYAAPVGNTKYMYINGTPAPITSASAWSNTTPSATTFRLGGNTSVNSNGGLYIAYLFATVAGVSKVGSYTGNGSNQTINCGFTAGARFIMIKRTDSTGDWYVWDTARGIVSGNDPRISMNSTAAEVTTDDSVDADSSGFIVNQLAATNINVNNASYIFLAVS